MSQPPEPLDSLYDRVRAVYLEIGCPEPFLARQAISPVDGRLLIEALRPQRPRTLVEVGTFVGVSTMLMALSLPDCRIWSVDPDPQLDESWKSARTEGSFPGAPLPTVHAVAQEAAKRLGVADRVSFVKGGFSCGDTYISAEGMGSISTIVGPSLLDTLGSVDAFFIDGLHYEWAVHADLQLAATRLAPQGVIVLHDSVGMWGTSVRAAVRRFLASHPRWGFRHPPLQRMYHSIAIVGPGLGAGSAAPNTASWLDQPIMAARIASELRRSSRLVRAAVGAGCSAIAECLHRDHGVSIERVRFDQTPTAPCDVLLTASIGEQGPLDPAATARWCQAHAASVLLAITPPGEQGVATERGAFRAEWVAAMRTHGFVTDETLPRSTDPWVYAGGSLGSLPSTSTRDLSLVHFVRAADRDSGIDHMQDRIEDLLASLVQLNVALAATRQELESLRVHHDTRVAALTRANEELFGRAEADDDTLRFAECMQRLQRARGLAASLARPLVRRALGHLPWE